MSRLLCIMCTHGATPVLPRAFGSVLLQTFTAWHLYLVNNGGDREALEDMLRMYHPIFGDRLSVIHLDEMMSPAKAASDTLQSVREKFIAMHGDGETWDVSFLRETERFLSASGNDGFSGVVTDGFVVREVRNGMMVRETGRSRVRREYGVLDYISAIKGLSFPAICFLFRRAALEDANFPDGLLPDTGDRNFILRLIAVGDIGVIPEPLATHHIPGGESAPAESRAAHDQATLGETRLRNRMLREAFRADPNLSVVLKAILDPVDDMSRRMEDLRHQLKTSLGEIRVMSDGPSSSQFDGQIHELLRRQQHMLDLMHVALGDIDQIRIVATWHKRLLTPVYWFWRTALPVRRRLARLRGRG
ncbi:glycosyltransferase [Acetobacter musti]|uniref:Glycosyltransferase n=1 Tax=Acetobacter musti TaxID=864732 RepID=A0ABX0JPR5_9PROT|nr:glycosyltransferase [Acetobacter musti]NHN83870.1 glycosyltransferase [Acetobacter musti]